jgi:hypothetical protein
MTEHGMSEAKAPAAEPLPPGTSRVGAAEAEAFLVGRFGAGVTDVGPIGGGAWSKAYAFRRDGAHFIARFGGYPDDFDLTLLPPDARNVESEEFRRAVTAYFAGEFADLGGTVAVDVGPDRLVVAWEPVGAETGLLARARPPQPGGPRGGGAGAAGPRRGRAHQHRRPL